MNYLLNLNRVALLLLAATYFSFVISQYTDQIYFVYKAHPLSKLN